MKKKSYKITKLERNRKSILTEDLDTCYLCGRNKDHLHEIYYGNNRQKSMEYNCVVPLCQRCHYLIHHNIDEDIKLKKKCQRAFMEYYEATPDEFRKIFYKNYL